jgi:hypothetical protein
MNYHYVSCFRVAFNQPYQQEAIWNNTATELQQQHQDTVSRNNKVVPGKLAGELC